MSRSDGDDVMGYLVQGYDLKTTPNGYEGTYFHLWEQYSSFGGTECGTDNVTISSLDELSKEATVFVDDVCVQSDDPKLIGVRAPPKTPFKFKMPSTLREKTRQESRERWMKENPDLSPEFDDIAYPHP
jgi:hypothetical protein